MRVLTIIGLFAGIALLVFLAWTYRGPALVTAFASSALPLACASAYRAVPLALYTLSWEALLPRAGGPRPRFLTLFRLRWIGESINALLPVAQVGGDMARARLLAARGVGGARAGGAMVADLALGTLTQVLFAIAGVAALASRSATADQMAGPIVFGIVTITAIAVVLFAVMRFGVAGVAARLPLWAGLRRRWNDHASSRLAGVDDSMNELVRDPRALVAAALWHLVGWFGQVGETWLVLALIRSPVSWSTALAIESLASTARGTAFFIPGGLGAQEGAIVYLCRMLGVPVEAALALSVTKRLRELVVGAPGLLAWAIAERRALRRLGSGRWGVRDA
jgi:putative membrane protein